MHEPSENQKIRQQKDPLEHFRQGKYRKINPINTLKIQNLNLYNY